MITLTLQQISQVKDASRFLDGMKMGKRLEIQVMDDDGNKIWEVAATDDLYRIIKKEVQGFLNDLGIKVKS